jgi:RanBP1 domain
MRQEKIQKLLVNHQVDPQIEMEKHPYAKRVYSWQAFDFSDGNTLVDTTFAFCFTVQHLADDFGKAFVAAQNHMTSLGYGNAVANHGDNDAADAAPAAAADNGETSSGEETKQS